MHLTKSKRIAGSHPHFTGRLPPCDKISRDLADLRSSPITSIRKLGAERRRERRYQVDLPAFLRTAAATWQVVVSDLSGGGALVSLPPSLEWVATPDVLLDIKEFGYIQARVVHVGEGFLGVQFNDQESTRERLRVWMMEEIATS